MPTCVEGHESVATDYCDVCGASLVVGQSASGPTAGPTACPACGMPITGSFCESCGHDSALPAPAEPSSAPGSASWTVVIAADREFYARVVARDGPDTVEFPEFFRERRMSLSGGTFLIGRANPRQGLEPDIDLGLHPADRGVSSQHAVLKVHDGDLTITDIGSTNGTSLNGSEILLGKNTETRLAAGDRIHVGAWTTLTVVRD